MISDTHSSGILRVSPDGVLKWKSRYYMDPWKDNSNIQLRLGWMDESKDGGIIVSGGYEYLNQWNELDEDVLIVKLDSMGCPHKDCLLTDTIIVLKQNITNVKDEKLSEAYTWNLNNDHSVISLLFDQKIKKPDLLIFLSDVNGKILTSKFIRAFEYNVEFSLSNHRDGIYFIGMNSSKLFKGFKFYK
jgi:hypothetical protein